MDDVFERASHHAKTLKNVSEKNMLQLYGLYKQANCGVCNISKPYFWDMTGKAKWESWNSFKDLSQVDSKQKYIELIKILDPSWNESDPIDENIKQPKGLGVSVSIMHQEEEIEIEESDKTIFDLCKEGNLATLKLHLEKNKKLINSSDAENLSLLHWAVDRNQINIVEYLLNSGVNVNIQDSDLQTPLHYAVTCEHKVIIKLLLHYGSDTQLKDMDGNTPIDNSNNTAIKKLLFL